MNRTCNFNRLPIVALVAAMGLALNACDNNSGSPSTPSANGNDFSSFVSAQLGNTPSSFPVNLQNTLASPPGESLASIACADAGMACGANATPLVLANVPAADATTFTSVQFTGGDTTPTGNYSAAAACTSLGASQCDPGLPVVPGG